MLPPESRARDCLKRLVAPHDPTHLARVASCAAGSSPSRGGHPVRVPFKKPSTRHYNIPTCRGELGESNRTRLGPWDAPQRAKPSPEPANFFSAFGRAACERAARERAACGWREAAAGAPWPLRARAGPVSGRPHGRGRWAAAGTSRRASAHSGAWTGRGQHGAAARVRRTYAAAARRTAWRVLGSCGRASGSIHRPLGESRAGGRVGGPSG